MEDVLRALVYSDEFSSSTEPPLPSPLPSPRIHTAHPARSMPCGSRVLTMCRGGWRCSGARRFRAAGGADPRRQLPRLHGPKQAEGGYARHVCDPSWPAIPERILSCPVPPRASCFPSDHTSYPAERMPPDLRRCMPPDRGDPRLVADGAASTVTSRRSRFLWRCRPARMPRPRPMPIPCRSPRLPSRPTAAGCSWAATTNCSSLPCPTESSCGGSATSGSGCWRWRFWPTARRWRSPAASRAARETSGSSSSRPAP